MRIALLADVHGNLPALQVVLADLEGFQPDLIAVAGDMTGGPHTNDCLSVLREKEAQMILGNSDLMLLRYLSQAGPQEWRTHQQFGLLRWNARHLSKDHFEFLSQLPEQRVVELPGTDAICLLHGSPGDPFKGLRPDGDPARLDHALDMVAEPVLACGHTHEPWYVRRNGKLALNPGSVAGPLNGEVGAQYAQMEWLDGQWQVRLKTIPYDFAQIEQAFIRSGLLQEGGNLARSWLLSIRSGYDVTRDFLALAYQLAEEAGYRDVPALPDKIWEQAGAKFEWENLE